MMIRLIAIAAATLAISTSDAMAETDGDVYRDLLALSKINSAGSSGTTMRCELPMRAIVNGHPVQPRRDCLDALGYSDLSPQEAEEVDRLNRQLLQKTSLQTECPLEMTRQAAGCRGRFIKVEPQGRGI